MHTGYMLIHPWIYPGYTLDTDTGYTLDKHPIYGIVSYLGTYLFWHIKEFVHAICGMWVYLWVYLVYLRFICGCIWCI